MEPIITVLIVLAIVVFSIVISSIKIVRQSTAIIVERLGKFHRLFTTGVHFIFPFIDKVVGGPISLKERVADFAPQPVITKDNVTMQIDTVIYYAVYDAKLYAYGAVNPISALSNLAATTLRNIVGELELDGTLTSRDTINAKMTEILDEATDKWGIKVNRVELKNIIPPTEIQNAMEKQMKAERDRRETLLQAEGHKAAAITRAEGDKQAMILAAEGERDARIARAEGEARAIFLSKKAEADGLRELKEAGVNDAVLELKKYEALVAMADGKASKIIVPSNVVDMTKANVIFSETSGLGDTTAPAPEAPKAKKKADPCCD